MNNSREHTRWNHCVKSLSLLLLCGSAFAPVAAQGTEWSPGYKYDMRGMVVRDADGNCVRTSQWSPTNAIEACDPLVVAERSKDKPIREEKARVTDVSTQVNLTTLQAGEAFEFDKADLSEAGRKMLSEVVDGYKDDYVHRVNVVGHTDRIGNPNYNMKLSERRADAVKAELVALGIPQERIRVSARGSDDPLVTCEGVAGAALIECLAPNRRTEVRFIIPKISTSAAAEFVARRRQEEVRTANIAAVEPAVVDTPLITRGFNSALKTVGDGCSREIADFCGDVELGDNRMLNCLNSNQERLSVGCRDALAQGHATVDAALGEANFFGAKCGPDLKNHCADVQPGEGQMLACLVDKINFVTKRCVDAMLELSLIDKSQYPFGKKSATP